jgi:hypothetical protein
MAADEARERYQKIYVRFAAAPRISAAGSHDPASIDLAGAKVIRQRDRELEVVVNGNATDVMARLAAHSPEAIETEALSLEEIFVTTLQSTAVPA